MKLFSKLAALTSCSAISLGMLAPALAQEADSGPQQTRPTQTTEPSPDVVVVNGFSQSLKEAREIARESDNLISVLSADDVGKLPDQNIAEALRRLDSVYLIRDQGEGRYVSIRGVDPILNNVTMNGQTLAVSDTDGESGRAAPLDVLSSSALSRIEIAKVTLPSMDGQSIGGTINIITPSGFDYTNGYLNLNAEYGYNDFGRESDIHSANVAWATTFGANDEFALFLSSEYWFKQYTSQQYTASGLWNTGAPAGYYFPGSMVFAQSIGEKERYGVNANFEWRPADDFRGWARYYFTQYNDYRDRPQITIATTAGTAAAPLRGFNNLNEFYAVRYTANMETRSEMQERPVHQLVIGGEKDFGENWSLTGNINYTTAKEVNPYQRYFQSTGVTANGTAANPAATFAINGDGLAYPVRFNTAVSNGLTFMDPGFERITAFRGVTSDVVEETWTANTYLKWDGLVGGRQLELSGGLKAILRDKSVDDTDYRYFPLTGQTYLLSSFPGLTSAFSSGRGNFYKPVPGLNLIAPDRYGYEAYFEANPNNFYYDAATSRANSMENDYTLSENIYAAYVMGNYHFTDALSVLAGVRVEQTDSDISAMGFVASATRGPNILPSQSRLPFATSEIVDISRSKSYTNVLPAVTMRWDIAKDWLFRASVTTNIGRPDYTDMAPISTIVAGETCPTPAASGGGCAVTTEINGSIEIGNPELEPYKGTNFDISLDYYFPDDSGSVTLGYFYKRVDNAIYTIVNYYEDYEFEGVTYNTLVEETAANAGPGYIQGLEFSVQKDFNFLPAPFDGFGVYANATLIDSEVEINVGGDSIDPELREVPFFNQADDIYNAQLYYDKGGFSARVAWSYQGDATSSAFGTNPAMDNFRSPRETVDARLSYTFDSGLQLWATGSNLNNKPALNYRNGDEFFVSSYELFGREYRVGVSMTW